MKDSDLGNFPTTLPRTLRLRDAIAIVVGSMIGAGIFRTPSSIAQILPYPGLIFIVWLVAGFICILGAICYGELSTLYPLSGGEYVYLREAYGKVFSFAFGWTKIFVIRAGLIAGISYVFAGYIGYFFPCSTLVQKLIASLTIFLLSFVNILGIRYGKGVQNVLTSVKVLLLIAIVAIGFLANGGNVQNFSPLFPQAESTGILSAFGLALIFALWTYGGWNESAYVGEEVKHPGRNLPLSFILGTVSVMALYMVVNYLWHWYVPIEKMQQTDIVAAGMMQNLFGPIGGASVSFVILISVLGVLNVVILTGGRIVYAFAQDHPLFSRLAFVDRTFKTPVFAIMLNAVWPVLLVFSGTFDQLVSFTSVGFWFFMGMTGISVFVFRKKYPFRTRPFKLLGYPYVPILFVIIAFCLVANIIVTRPIESLIGIGIIASSIPIYFISRFVGKAS